MKTKVYIVMWLKNNGFNVIEQGVAKVFRDEMDAILYKEKKSNPKFTYYILKEKLI